MFVAALVVILLLSCGCDEGKCGEDILEVSSAVSSEQVYPVGSYERRAAEFAASGADITGREVTDFGEESIFGEYRWSRTTTASLSAPNRTAHCGSGLRISGLSLSVVLPRLSKNIRERQRRKECAFFSEKGKERCI